MSKFYPVDSTEVKPLPPFPDIEWMDIETVEALRRMTVSEKLHLVGKINREVRRRVAESIRTCHRDWSDEQCSTEFRNTMLTATYESLTEFMPTNIVDL